MASGGSPQVAVIGAVTSKRIEIQIEGIVQGVGFRPFIYRLAADYGLSGWVKNTPSGVFIEVQGAEARLEAFQSAVREQAPPLSVISSFLAGEIPAVEERGFVIRESGGSGSEVQIAPDCDVCADCLQELFDPQNRRFRYPFINCTNCGPRYTIIQGMPYDRAHTTMSAFPMCDDCLSEYKDPGHRRFHAQPNACPVCGPSLRLLDRGGKGLEGDPLDTAITLLRDGKILALKGLGGYHLAVDACNVEAVLELRRRKKRDEKPFALMSPGLREVREYALVDEIEKKLLQGPERPIVLLRKMYGNPIASLVAPTNGYFGVMLPYTPLHHLLLRDNFTALVMTSGNLSDEPISYRDQEALQRLPDIADYFLTHNREIHTRTDDSVIRVFQGNPIFLRRSRGYVPRSISLPAPQASVLALGAELKSAVCLTRGNKAFLSQHIGDLQNTAVLQSMSETTAHLSRIMRVTPEIVAHDLHPDYLSTAYAAEIADLPKMAVQHHHAHMASCMAEHRLEGDVIGVIFDGTGYGEDGHIWGGEFLAGGYEEYSRKGHFRYLPLPGGDAAVRDPFRMALSCLYQVFGNNIFNVPLTCVSGVPVEDRGLFLQMLEKRLNSPLTSSCGRLFDAVAALIGLRPRVSYEGQAAIELEGLADNSKTTSVYPYSVESEKGSFLLDFIPMIRAIVDDMLVGVSIAEIARAFHNTVAAATAEVCGLIRHDTGISRVVLSGGVFQNKLLSEGICGLLAERGFDVFTQRLAPPNDGGISLGQAIIAGRRFKCA